MELCLIDYQIDRSKSHVNGTLDSLIQEMLGTQLLDIQDHNGVTGNINMAEDGSMRIRENAFILQNGFPVKIE